MKKFNQYLFGRKFTLYTDNKALKYIFDPQGSSSSIAANRLVRWSIILNANDYVIEYKSTTENGNADLLSRLTIKESKEISNGNMLYNYQICTLPVSADLIRRESIKDNRIEQLVKSCSDCAKVANCPPKTKPHPWDWPANPMDRVHLDFFGPFYGSNCLIMVDSFSDWIEATEMTNTRAVTTIEFLRSWFSRFGIPKTSIYSHGVCRFCWRQWNKACYIAYVPQQSNGITERCVQTIKKALQSNNVKSTNIQRKLHNFLLAYHTTPSAKTSKTDKTPSELFMGRCIDTRIDLVRPEYLINSSTQREAKFEKNYQVLVKHFVGGKKWLSGKIVRQLSSTCYKTCKETCRPLGL